MSTDAPVPDPTVLTTEALERGLKAERDYVDGRHAVILERLEGIDRATELLSATVNRVPTDVTKEVGHLSSLLDEKLASVATQFKERDTRSEREARDNKLAVDAAFAAQEKQAVAESKANADAINKSERATTETIKTNQELATTKIEALEKRLSELALQISRIDASKQGAQETRDTGRAATTTTTAVVGAFVSVIVLVLLLVATYTALHRSTPTPATPVVVTVTTGGTP